MLLKQKANYTVEAALVMPVVFGVLLAVLFFILMMYQQASSRALMNRFALMASNTVTRAHRGPTGHFDPAVYRRSVWHFYFRSSNDHFNRSNFQLGGQTPARYFGPRVGRVLRSFNIFQDSTLSNITVSHTEARIELRGNAVHRVQIPFYGTMRGDFITIATAPEINPSRFIRGVDDANFFLLTAFEAADGDVVQLIVRIIELLTGRNFSDT